MEIAPRDRVPGASGVLVTFTFTTATDMEAGDRVTIGYPAEYFKVGSPTTFEQSATSIFISPVSSSAAASILISVASDAPAATYKLVLRMTMGSPRVTTYGVYVETTRDLMSPVVSAPALGGKVTGVTFSMFNRVPHATGAVLFEFTLATALFAGFDSITLRYPQFFLAPGIYPSSWGVIHESNTGFNPVVQMTTASSVVMNLVDIDVAPGKCIVTVSGVKFGPPTSGSETGITVSTSKDVASAGVASGSLGGQVTSVSWTVAAAYRIPRTAAAAAPYGNAVTVGFTLATAFTSTTTSNAITVTFPSGFFVASDASVPVVACTQAFGSAPTATVAALTNNATQFVLSITSAWDASRKTCVFSNVATGGATAGSSAVSVSSSQDRQSTFVASGSLGGQVTGVSFTIAAADRVPGATGKSITFSFVAATALAIGQAVTLTYPSGFFEPWPNPSHVASFYASIGQMGVTSVVLTTTAVVVPGAHTVTVSGVTIGAPNAGSASGISVATSTDLVSVGAASGALGGQVTGVSFTIAAADRVPFASGKSVTLTFTIATSLFYADSLTLSFPNGFISGGWFPSSSGYIYVYSLSGSSNFSPSLHPSATSIVMRVYEVVTAGSYIVTLGGLTFGPPTHSTAEITVSTSKDYSSAGVASGSLGGQVTGVSFTIAAADRVPFASGKSVTLTFTISTALAATDTITVSYPAGFLLPFASPAAIPLDTTCGAPAATSVVLTVAAGRAIAVGAYTLTLTGITFGAALASCSDISVSTIKDRAGTCERTPWTALGKNTIRSTVDIFDSATGAWSQTVLSSARFHLASTSLLSVALFAGGFNGLPPSGNSRMPSR
jgi:hypothetical protein